MNLVITADWPITNVDRLRAEQATYDAYKEILPLALLALPAKLIANPWSGYDATLTVVLHATVFDNRSGQTHWAAPGADSKIEIAWDVQNQEGQNPLLHEFGHWLALQAGDPNWGEFGHGTPKDKLMLALKGALKTAYFGNFGAAFLDYKEIDFSAQDGLSLSFDFDVENGKLQCEVSDKYAHVIDFTKDEGREWMWLFRAQGGKLRPRSFDKVDT